MQPRPACSSKRHRRATVSDISLSGSSSDVAIAYCVSRARCWSDGSRPSASCSRCPDVPRTRNSRCSPPRRRATRGQDRGRSRLIRQLARSATMRAAGSGVSEPGRATGGMHRRGPRSGPPAWPACGRRSATAPLLCRCCLSTLRSCHERAVLRRGVETRPAGAVAESPELGPCPGSLQRSATGRRKTVRASGALFDLGSTSASTRRSSRRPGCARRSRPSRWPLGTDSRGVARAAEDAQSGNTGSCRRRQDEPYRTPALRSGRHRQARQRRCRQYPDRHPAAGAAARHHDQGGGGLVPDRRDRRQPDRHPGPPGLHCRG